jgi:hypothetical protein
MENAELKGTSSKDLAGDLCLYRKLAALERCPFCRQSDADNQMPQATRLFESPEQNSPLISVLSVQNAGNGESSYGLLALVQQTELMGSNARQRPRLHGSGA